MVSKMILSSSELGCSEEIITIAATLSVQVNCFIYKLSVPQVQ
jgi:HrpA-like RNA helicase